MKLSTANKILRVLLVLVVLEVACSVLSVDVRNFLKYPLVATVLALIVVWVGFMRCPHCGQILRLRGGRYCAKCGREVDLTK